MTPLVAPALLVVDVQAGVMAASINAPQVIAAIAGLVERARATGIPVVWVRHSDAGLPLGSDRWQIVPELVPASSEIVIEKTYGDSFAETDLDEKLRGLGVHTVVLCGAQSDFCIRSTLNGSLYRGYSVVLASDAHTTEDLREWGANFGPEQAIGVVNFMAEHTRLPGVTAGIAPSAELFV